MARDRSSDSYRTRASAVAGGRRMLKSPRIAFKVTAFQGGRIVLAGHLLYAGYAGLKYKGTRRARHRKLKSFTHRDGVIDSER